MMKNLLSCLLLLSITTLAVSAQEYIAPSADAFGIAKLTTTPVNHYTGAVTTTIPLAQIGGRELSVPVSLSYSASGHRVTEIASSAGLGWALNAGGVITRVVRGTPDDLTNGFCKPNFSDKEPDMFYYSFLGQGGKFIIDKYARPLLMPHRDILITTNICAQGANGSWQIIDEQGVIYKFGTSSGSRETTTATNTATGTKVYTSAWYLSQIISPNFTDTVSFSYTTGYYSFISNMFKKTTDKCNSNLVTDLSSTISVSTRHVSSISSALGSVAFSYIGQRKDLPGSAPLTSIEVRNMHQQQIAKFRFEHSYFQAGGASPNCYRLKLDKVYDLAPDPLFTFTYNTSVLLPPRDSKNFDLWGFYNANTTNSWFPQITNKDAVYMDGYSPSGGYASIILAGASREADEARSLANILISTARRGGETKTFTYEGHQVYAYGINYPVGGARIKTITTADGNGNSYTQTFNYASATNSAQSSGRFFRRPFYIVGSLYGYPWSHLDQYMLLSHSFLDIYDLGGTYIGYSRVEETVSGRGRKEYVFTNFDTRPNPKDGSFRETDVFWERGNAHHIKTFDTNGQLLLKERFNYYYTGPNFKSQSFDFAIGWSFDCHIGFWQDHWSGNPHEAFKCLYVSRPFYANKIITTIYEPGDTTRKTVNVQEIEIDSYTLLPTQTTAYNDNLASHKVITRKRYPWHQDYTTYDNCAEDQASCNTGCESEPDPVIRSYCYTDCQNAYNTCVNSPPSNLDGPSLAIYHLRGRHQTAIPVETSLLVQDGTEIKTVSSMVNTYQLQGVNSNQIQPKEVWSMSQPVGDYLNSRVAAGAFEKDPRMRKVNTFNTFDQVSGRLTQQTSLSGVQQNYVWGHRNTAIREVNSFGGINTRQTESTYKIMVGPTSHTDVNDRKTYTDYDVYNRPSIIKDHNANILSRTRYHYKNETPGFRISPNRVESLVNETYYFTAVDIASSIGGTPQFVWDLGDGTVIDNNSTYVSHTYSSPGVYTVKLVGLNPEYGPTTRTLQVGVHNTMSLDICADGATYIDLCGIQPSYFPTGTCFTGSKTDSSPVDLTVTVSNGCPSEYTYTWEYKRTTDTYFTPTGDDSPTLSFYPPYTGGEVTYEVRCTVTDGCSNTAPISYYIQRDMSDDECQPINPY